MGLVVTAEGANFESSATSFNPPVASGLRYWGFTNDSVARLGNNYALNGDALSVIGAPVVDSKGATMDNANYIQTTIHQPASFTLLVVGNPLVDGAEQGMFISNYSGGRAGDTATTSWGVSLHCASNDAVAGKFNLRASVSRFSGQQGAATAQQTATLFNRDITKPGFFAMTYSGTEKVIRVYDLGVGDVAESAAIADQTDIASTPFFIGSSPVSFGAAANQRRIHFAAIYDRQLTKAEINLVYDRVKVYLAGRSVSI